ncbi:MAG: glycosyltransferase family 4 protein [Candidatus Aenigmatarchaeota archaeon]
MKVLLICRSFDKNSGQGIYKMAGYLYENLLKYTNIKAEKIDSPNKNPYYFDLIESPAKTLKNNFFDVYHFLMPEVCLSILFSKVIREKSIVTIHDAIIYKIKERKWLSEKYIKLMYNIAKNAKVIITPSHQSKNDLVKFVKINKKKIYVIPWGIDIRLFRPLQNKKGNDKLIVGYIGGLGKRKNVEWILSLAKNFPESIFKIAGVGPKLKKLKKLKEKLKLNNVEFAGFVKENGLPRFYNSLNVFIFPSFYEGFGVPLLEAMACEVPYIIGTNAGIGEILPIYKISKFEELENILLKIRDGKLQPLRNQRKWIIKNKLTWKNCVRNLVKVYEEII